MSTSIHNSRETKPKGWFSRRHQTRTAHDQAVERYQATRGPWSHEDMADSNARAAVSGLTQVQALDDRLGAGVGAVRERARLAAQEVSA